MTEFLAVDGEGLTRDDDSHDYATLQASDGSIIECWDRGGLSSIECLDYLIERKQLHPQAELIGFSFGYDTNMLLRDIPRNVANRLHENNSVDWVPSKGLRYFFNYIPSKWFSVTRYHWVPGPGWWRDGYAKVWDVFGFYQTSFVKAIEDWKVATKEQTAAIQEMKLKRGSFTDEEKEEIKSYCWEECRFLVDLGNQLDEALIDADLEIKQYHGAGAIANVLLKRERANDYIVRRPDNDLLWDAILRGFFGGRIETFIAGFVPDPVFSYDINSAYPTAIKQLPDMKNGTWVRTRTYDPDAEFALWRVRWTLNEQERLAPFPFRHKDGSIYYVANGEGWYHAPEVREAMRAYGGKRGTIDIRDGVVFRPDSNLRPFSWVEAIYRERQQAKREGHKREKVLKLGMNSLYGKFAQGVSGRNRPGPFQCYFFAGWITSYCRAQMIRVGSQNPNSLVAIATDGIFSLAPLSVDEGRDLGQWEVKDPIDEGLMVVQPGLIVSRYESLVRTRGVDRSSIGFDVFRKAWSDLGIAAKVQVTDTRFISLGRALQSSDNTAEMNQVWRRWRKWNVDVSYFPERKRVRMTAADWMPEGHTPLFLLDGWPGELSAIYSKGQGVEQEVEPVEFIDELTAL